MKHILFCILLSVSNFANSAVVDIPLTWLAGEKIFVSDELDSITFLVQNQAFQDYKIDIVDAEVFLDFDANTLTANRELTLHLYGDYVQWFDITPGQKSAKEQGGNWQNPSITTGMDVEDLWKFDLVLWPSDAYGNISPVVGDEYLIMGDNSYIRFSNKKQEIYIPEPSTLAGMILGLLGIGVARRRKA